MTMLKGLIIKDRDRFAAKAVWHDRRISDDNTPEDNKMHQRCAETAMWCAKKLTISMDTTYDRVWWPQGVMERRLRKIGRMVNDGDIEAGEGDREVLLEPIKRG